MESKICNTCKEEKPFNAFYPAKTKLGNPTLNSSCILCVKYKLKEQNLKKRNNRPRLLIENLPEEIWVPVKGFEDKYYVSNLGRVKSLDRMVYRKVVGKEVFIEGKLLAQSSTDNGKYPGVTLYGASKDEKYPTPVYIIVFFSFNPDIEKKEGWEVDHKDQIRANSKLENLQYITSRDNCIKRSLHNKTTSKYPGVSWCKNKKRWQTGIRYNGGKYSLGRYDSEEEAAKVYQSALSKIIQGLSPV